MRIRNKPRRTGKHSLPRSDSADEILEFVFNDEEEALSSAEVALIHQRDMPALQEFLREMSELDSRSLCVRLQ